MPRGPSHHVDSPEAVGQRLRQARADAGLTQRDLSFKGCTAAYVSRIEAGVRRPSMQIIQEFAKRLKVDADWLATGKLASDPVSRIQRLVREVADQFPEDEQEAVLQPVELLLTELIAQHAAEAEKRRQEILDGLRETLEGSPISDDEVEEIVQRANRAFREANSRQ